MNKLFESLYSGGAGGASTPVPLRHHRGKPVIIQDDVGFRALPQITTPNLPQRVDANYLPGSYVDVTV